MSTPYTPSSNKRTSYISPGGGNTGSLGGSDISRVLPRQLSTGSTRGTQTVGYGNTKIDGSNNRITIGTPDGGSIGMGSIPGTDPVEYGFFSTDDSGNVIMKIVNGTKYVYNPSDDYVNVTQDGLLPDGSGGFVAAKPGINVADLYAG